MKHENVTYQAGNTSFNGIFSFPDESKKKRPAIIVAHTWRGLDHFAKEKADQLAELGYIAFAADLFGGGIEPATDEECGKMIMPLVKNRKELQTRIKAAFDVVSRHPQVDSSRIGAIGFCFGGLTVLELLRSGADVHGVVSFHGALGHELHGEKATLVPIASHIKGSLLVLHGHDDPLVSEGDLISLQKEWTDAKIDWQLHVYGNTTHAFTNYEATSDSKVLQYQPVSAARAWQSMRNFFEEVL